MPEDYNLDQAALRRYFDAVRQYSKFVHPLRAERRTDCPVRWHVDKPLSKPISISGPCLIIFADGEAVGLGTGEQVTLLATR